jgi:MerR family transcriptional regulator, light-induced transcriptional regulator
LSANQAKLTEARDGYVTLQLRGDRREALTFVDALVSRGYSIADIQKHVIAAGQREIGRLWEESRIGIAQEHMATAISQLALAQLYRYAKPHPPRGRKVVVGCVEGELHDFPARLLADELDLAGFETRFLGADVPTGSLLQVLDQEKPDLLALSITMPFHISALRRQVTRVREHTNGKLPIAIGGVAALQLESVLRELSPEIISDNTADFMKAIDQLPGVAA